MSNTFTHMVYRSRVRQTNSSTVTDYVCLQMVQWAADKRAHDIFLLPRPKSCRSLSPSEPDRTPLHSWTCPLKAYLPCCMQSHPAHANNTATIKGGKLHTPNNIRFLVYLTSQGRTPVGLRPNCVG
jgi:hypothetical protein